MADVAVGDVVAISAVQCGGTIRFIGNTEFAQGEWLGVELDEPSGKNDGSVKGVQYFTCKDGHGIFVRRAHLAQAVNGETLAAPKSPSGNARTESRPSKPNIKKRRTKNRASAGDFGDTTASSISPGSSPKRDSSVSPGLSEKRDSSIAKTRSSTARKIKAVQQQLAEAVEERNVELIRHLLTTANSVGGISEKELQAAYGILTYEDKRSVMQEFQGVARAMESLNSTIKKAEDRALEIEKRAEASQVNLTRSVAGTALREWLTQVVGLVEQRVWATLEERVETKVRNAVKNVTQELNDAAMRLQALRKSGGVMPSRQGQVKEKRQRQAAPVSNASASGELSKPTEKARAVTGASPQEVAAMRIQRMVRGNQARERLGKRSPFASVVVVAKRRNDAWHQIFMESAEGMPPLLDLSAFCKALLQVHGRLSTAQVRALWDGYLENTSGGEGVELRGFCYICEAVAAGDQYAAELADISAKSFQMLAGQEAAITETPAEPLQADMNVSCELEWDVRSLAARRIQRLVRGNQARVRLGKRTDFYSALVIVRRRNNAWHEIFIEMAKGRPPVLDFSGFHKALLEVHKRLSAAQIRALWNGYLDGSGNNSIGLRDFCGICEAAAAGDDEAAEHADMPLQEFQSLASQEDARAVRSEAVQLPDARSVAASRIQRVVRGNLARLRLGKRASFASVAVIARRRNGAWHEIFMDMANGRPPLLDSTGFCSAVLEVHRQLSSAQVRALWTGSLEMTGDDAVDLKEFCNICHAVAIGDDAAAEYADLPIETFKKLARQEDKQSVATFAPQDMSVAPPPTPSDARSVAAAKIQRIVRGNQARARLGKGNSFKSIVAITVKRNSEWHQIFMERAKGKPPFLDLCGFRLALLEVHRRLSTAQARAIWNGYLENSGSSAVDLKGFCRICEAVAEGDDRAAEYADIPVLEFQKLASRGAVPQASRSSEAASVAAKRIQRVVRGNQARARVKKRTSLAGIVAVVTRRNKAWVDIFNEACEGSRGLTLDGLMAAMSQIHPQLSAAQVVALFDGFCNGTGCTRIGLKDFCAICEAVAMGDLAASEYADIDPEAFSELGSEGS